MFNTQQYSPAEALATADDRGLFQTAPPRRLPGPASGDALFTQGCAAQPAQPMPVRAFSPSNPVAGSTVTPWYRAKRVWLAGALLLAAVSFRVAAAPEPPTLQSAVVPATSVTD